NSADGTIEICKQMDDSNWMPSGPPNGPQRASVIEGGGNGPDGGSPYNGTPFYFSINGGTPIEVDAGACSPAIAVPAGTATVQEESTPNFNLEGFTAVGPDGSSRLVSGTNPITVNVPFGGVGNETLVTATNKVQTAQVKVCKELDTAVPAGKTFHFDATFELGNGDWEGDYPLSLKPTGDGPSGEVCTNLSMPVPVIDGQGDPTTITVTECDSPFGYTDDGADIVEPTSITYAGNGSVVEGSPTVYQPGDSKDLDGSYNIQANLGQGVNEITFLNSFVVDP
ncbi:hypothetical protein, partial [Jatrophihabitans endophyticus]|uniref:hypothetical protein n=1 Tax=Jatrophihabitans endophyticus TaxID=1206085 RepID=UPI0019DD26ED